jgi:hypothetical protein
MDGPTPATNDLLGGTTTNDLLGGLNSAPTQ